MYTRLARCKQNHTKFAVYICFGQQKSRTMSDIGDDELIWSFGYGSNMDVASVESKKGVKIKESSPAVLQGYRLCFNIKALKFVEPAFANVRKSEGSEVHGVAFCMTGKDMRRLDQQEPYNKHYVTLKAYKGQDLRGFIYIQDKGEDEETPSTRYMGVLIKGALAAGLTDDYVEKLRQIKTYSPPEWILQMRRDREASKADLKAITMEELAKHNEEADGWVSILGIVVRPVRFWGFKAHRGRDITARQLMHYKQISLDRNDDGGQKPFPLVSQLAPDELEYVTRWLDHYQARGSTDGKENMGEIVGFLKDFREQQESGKSEFKLPEQE